MVVVIVAPVVFENGNAAPVAGRISKFTRVLAGTGVTLNAISICWFCVIASRLKPDPPSFAVKTVSLEVLP